MHPVRDEVTSSFRRHPGRSRKRAIRFQGRKPARKAIDMSGDPACVEAHHNKAYDEYPDDIENEIENSMCDSETRKITKAPDKISY